MKWHRKDMEAAMIRTIHRHIKILITGDFRTVSLVFFFQAEDGIRDLTVTGVQTCALPIYSNSLRSNEPNQFDNAGFQFDLPEISPPSSRPGSNSVPFGQRQPNDGYGDLMKIGRASCRERV